MPNDKSDNKSKNVNDHHPEDVASEMDLLSEPSHAELTRQLNEAEVKANQYWERIMRMQAESDNAARRAERDVANAHKYALEKFATELLPIIDSLELCLSNEVEAKASGHSLIEGVNLTLKLFYAAMEKFGIKQINPISAPFDSEYQQAISTQYVAGVEPGMVLEVLQKGYTLHSRLLRPALVVVSKAKE